MLVLGIDAAWTETGSSGVALLMCTRGARHTLKVESSYAGFVGDEVYTGGMSGPIDAGALLGRSKAIAGRPVDLVAIDMPISRKKVVGRRAADDAISREFGRHWASTHSPTPTRPGAYGERVTTAFVKAGYPLATDRAHIEAGRALIEVFPLAALVRLMAVQKRPAYKVGKISRYWRNETGLTREQKFDRLFQTWGDILGLLRREIPNLDFELAIPSTLTFSHDLKAYEDQIDALISACVGAYVLEGRARPFGDTDSAIWIPAP